ncbi:suppressor of los1-1 [Sorochytrium milnesiophthora]
MELYAFPTVAALSPALAHYVVQLASQHAQRFTIALSGGSLPKQLADGLAPLASSIDFSTWQVFFADERCVSHDDPESNYKLCKDTLFEPLVGKNGSRLVLDQNVHAINPALVGNPEQAASDYQSKMESVFGASGLPKLDLILLGMGPDGHTCSLFPGHKLLTDASGRYILSLTDSPKPPPSRITFSLPLVNNAHAVAFVCAGAGKAPAVKEALEGSTEPSKKPLPSALVKPTSGHLRWFTDEAAVQSVTKIEKKQYKL